MIYSPHTFEIALNLDTNKFSKLKNKAYGKTKGNHRVYSENDVTYDYALAKHGIKVEYHDGIYKKKIKLIVNPTKTI